MLLLGLVAAFFQPPKPDPLDAPGRTDTLALAWERFLWPVERNAISRLPSVDVYHLNALAMSADGARAWVAGEKGSILVSDDLGRSWAPQRSGTNVSLHSIVMMPYGHCGWVTGAEGTLLKTESGGRAWQPQSIDSKQIRGILMLEDCRHGWIEGQGRAWFITDDGGAHWNQTLGFAPLKSPAMRPEDQAAIRLRATGEAGDSWAAFAESSSATSMAVARSGKLAWAVGPRGAVGRTTDGGHTWQGSNLLPRETFGANIAVAEDLRHGILTTYTEGMILFTDDGGQSWHPTANPLAAPLTDSAISWNGRFALAVGEYGAVLASNDGGRSWIPRSRGHAAITDIALQPGSKTAWAIAGAYLLKSADGGATWAPQQGAHSPAAHSEFRSIQVSADGQRLWVASRDDVFRSEDGGESWVGRGAAAARPDRRSRHPPGRARLGRQRRGWPSCAGDRDGGASWSGPVHKAPFSLKSISVAENGALILAVGQGPAIVASRDGGRTWQETDLLLGRLTFLNDVAIAKDGRHALVVGRHRTLLATMDGGETWSIANVGPNATLNDVVLLDDDSGWIGGDNGTLLRFEDLGSKIQPMSSPFRSDVTAVALQPDGSG